MKSENANYTAYDYRDQLQEGMELKIIHSILLNNGGDLSNLISKPLSEVRAMYEKSVEVERVVFNKIREMVKQWEKQAAITQKLDRAIKYLQTPETEHTNNQWIMSKGGNDYNCISNKVYKMLYRINEWGRPTKYEVIWDVWTNSPWRIYNTQIAGQRRTFKDKDAAGKYIQGRIKAYAHLFTEISPAIPKEYAYAFKVYGQLLPGYTVENN